MPTYCYRCSTCGVVVEEQRAMADRRIPVPCSFPGCDGTARLAVALGADTFPGAAYWREVQKSRGTP